MIYYCLKSLKCQFLAIFRYVKCFLMEEVRTKI